MSSILTTIRTIIASFPAGLSPEAAAQNPELFDLGTQQLRKITR